MAYYWKTSRKLRGYSSYEATVKTWKNIVYDSLTKEELEDSWNTMLYNYDFLDNAWFGCLYEERRRWVSAFVKSVFWGGMSDTTKRNMHAFFWQICELKNDFKTVCWTIQRLER